LSIGRPEWPEVGELVVATVKSVASYGAYVTLDEYNDKEGLLHISEISSRWVRNIRNHVREREKVVLHILRVDSSRDQIDLSLRRVNRDERRKKLEDWKKNRKAETLLKAAASNLDMSLEDLYGKEGVKIVESYGSLYEGLEAVAKRGAEALIEAGVSKKAAKALEEIAKDKIVVKGVTIHGFIEMTSMEPRGVEEIRETLLGCKKAAAENEAEAALFSMGAPKYRIEVTAEDYRTAETALEKIVEQTTQVWSQYDGKFSFTRE
jgi:translation initiation factor 2 subunit 1